ncbi:hypothetical protein QYF61_008089 [Mycteria americana]|uniref:Uncharacterized protein n=1 Tax=Mycteria americana TaxID=33587 RepID=A0AAN7PR42_MYCAM|nr:hypothetical protein QYF61_008089 [Mycteria americana]
MLFLNTREEVTRIPSWSRSSGIVLLALLPFYQPSSHFAQPVANKSQIRVTAWGPTHGIQFFMTLSNVGPSHGLQFFKHCSSIGPFLRVQSFRNGLLRCRPPMGSLVPPENLLQRGALLYRAQLLPGACTGVRSPWAAASFRAHPPALPLLYVGYHLVEKISNYTSSSERFFMEEIQNGTFATFFYGVSSFITITFQYLEHPWVVKIHLFMFLGNIVSVLSKISKQFKNIIQRSAPRLDSYEGQGVWDSTGKCLGWWAPPMFWNFTPEQYAVTLAILGRHNSREVTCAEEAPLYNKLPENEKQCALFTDGSCRIVGKHRRWKAAIWSPIREVVETAEGEGESSQSADVKAMQLALDIAE